MRRKLWSVTQWPWGKRPSGEYKLKCVLTNMHACIHMCIHTYIYTYIWLAACFVIFILQHRSFSKYLLNRREGSYRNALIISTLWSLKKKVQCQGASTLCRAVCQLARPDDIASTGVDVLIGPCQLAKSCRVTCQLEPDWCRSASKDAAPFLKRVGSRDVPIGLRRL